MLLHQSKGVIVVSCSPFSTALANTLYHRGRKVVVLDKDRESFRYLPKEFGGSELEEDPIGPRVSKEAGIERAGMIIVVTQDDNSSLLIFQIASDIFQVGRVYVRLDDISRCHPIADMSIQPTSLYNLSAGDYKDLADSANRGVAI